MPRSKEPRDIIEEYEPLELAPKPAQPAFASTGLQLEVRCRLFEGMDIALSNIIDDTVDEMEGNARLDMMRRMVERQRTVFEHRETMLMLKTKQITLRQTPGLLKEYTEKRAREYASGIAKYQIRWNRDRRGEFRLQGESLSWSDQFNDETEKKMQEFEKILADYPGEIKNLEDRIERCKRVLEGIEKTDLLLDLDPWDSQREAAE